MKIDSAPDRILAVNSGSSSLKFGLFEEKDGEEVSVLDGAGAVRKYIGAYAAERTSASVFQEAMRLIAIRYQELRHRTHRFLANLPLSIWPSS